MKQKRERLAFLSLALAVIASGASASQAPDSGNGTPVKIERGTVSFEVATNVFATQVHGKSSALTGTTRVLESESGLKLEGLEATVPVETLQTGIKLRDQHMRKYIFQTADGQLPDVRFSAGQTDCSRAPAAGEFACVASGTLVIRGTSQPFAMALKIERKGDGFRVNGDGRLTLSKYGIERPTQLGVTTDDEVKIHLELDARTTTTTAARVR